MPGSPGPGISCASPQGALPSRPPTPPTCTSTEPDALDRPVPVRGPDHRRRARRWPRRVTPPRVQRDGAAQPLRLTRWTPPGSTATSSISPSPRVNAPPRGSTIGSPRTMAPAPDPATTAPSCHASSSACHTVDCFSTERRCSGEPSAQVDEPRLPHRPGVVSVLGVGPAESTMRPRTLAPRPANQAVAALHRPFGMLVGRGRWEHQHLVPTAVARAGGRRRCNRRPTPGRRRAPVVPDDARWSRPAPRRSGAMPAPRRSGAMPAPRRSGAMPAPRRSGAMPAPRRSGAMPAPRRSGAMPAPRRSGGAAGCA